MKKILFVLTLIFVTLFAGCGGDSNSAEKVPEEKYLAITPEDFAKNYNALIDDSISKGKAKNSDFLSKMKITGTEKSENNSEIKFQLADPAYKITAEVKNNFLRKLDFEGALTDSSLVLDVPFVIANSIPATKNFSGEEVMQWVQETEYLRDGVAFLCVMKKAPELTSLTVLDEKTYRERMIASGVSSADAPKKDLGITTEEFFTAYNSALKEQGKPEIKPVLLKQAGIIQPLFIFGAGDYEIRGLAKADGKIYLVALFAKSNADPAEIMALAKSATQKTKANPEKFKELLADTTKEAISDNGVVFQVGQKEDGSMRYFVLEEDYFNKKQNE